MSAHGRASWVAIVTLAALVAGLGVYVAQWQRQPVDTALEAPALADTSDALIQEALAAAPVDSAELRNRWLDEVPNVDVSMLTMAQNKRFVRAANSYRCSCGCGFTLATCRAYDTTCPVSGPRVNALRDSIRAGLVSDEGLRSPPPPGQPSRL